ncbi:MAG: HAMP domain-containing protein [Candidatus Hydrogenedentes bacterium]|nr:HAMP domain-containing protein [Candidatus Hydrogenedentota bacterium]
MTRILVLCGVLLVLLLGMVEMSSRYLFHEIKQQMDLQTQGIADSIQFYLDKNPTASLDEVARVMKEGNPDQEIELKLEEPADPMQPKKNTIEFRDGGKITKIIDVFVDYPNRQMIHARAQITIASQTLLFGALTNRYLMLLVLGFLVTLGLMVYFIGRLLRPLGELSESCAQISEGTLRNVVVRKSAGEIRALERTFNKMVASLRDKEIVEANLRQAQRLTAIGTLAAGVAHDIRNPLNSIKLLSSHTLDHLDSLPDGEQAALHVRTIRNEVDRLEEIVSGFLSLAKERELRPEPSKIDGLLDECVRLVQPDAEAREVRLTAELRAGETILMLDPKQWTRAILNVLINALEACPKEGRVRLFSRLTETTCEIEIRDDGPGLSKDVSEHAFDPYFTTKATGTGLGLSITRGIVEEHGGAIQLSGADGQGCQVLIKLPLDKRMA